MLAEANVAVSRSPGGTSLDDLMRLTQAKFRVKNSCYVQVGLMRRGRYVKGKKVGKGNIINNVRLHA